MARMTLVGFALWAALAATPDWMPLFDGNTLAGWHVTAKAQDRERGFWKVEDGAITADSRGRKDHDYVWLVNDREFGDFELRLKIRGFRESQGNSGVQVRSRYDEAAQWMNGPQVDVHPPAPWRTGLIYDETRGVQHWIYPVLPDWRIEPQQGPKEWKWKYSDEGDGWNELTVTCRGTHITTRLNGIIMADFDGAGVLDDAAHRVANVGMRGHVALQLHTRDDVYIQYKDIAVRELR